MAGPVICFCRSFFVVASLASKDCYGSFYDLLLYESMGMAYLVSLYYSYFRSQVDNMCRMGLGVTALVRMTSSMVEDFKEKKGRPSQVLDQRRRLSPFTRSNKTFCHLCKAK